MTISNEGLINFVIVNLLIYQKVLSLESVFDNDFYNINWRGPLHDDAKPLKQDSIIVTTNNNEKYQCILPVVNSKSRSKFPESISSAKLELDFLRSILDSNFCVYRLEIYWTYEFCHGRHIRQYHEELENGKLPGVQEYYLGRYNRERYNGDLAEAKLKRQKGIEMLPSIIKVQGMSMPYYEVVYTEGTTCDLNNTPRRSRVLYVCYPEAKGEIYELKETSSCEYEVVILTSLLCQHPSYGPRKDPIHGIDCHAIKNSPSRPLNLEVFELQNTLGGYSNPEEEIAGAIWDIVKAYVNEEEKGKSLKAENLPEVKVNQESQAPGDVVSKALPSSRQIIVDFFNGDYCIQGGSGWWKHELCFGKYVRQFHEDPKGKEVITLGVWDEAKHLEWLNRNPLKRPKPRDERKLIHNFYGGGSICHETGKSRTVEVRLDCLKQTGQSNAISLYLLENVLCEYKLIVEASMFCGIIERADDNGLVRLEA